MLEKADEMTRVFVYLLLFGVGIYFISMWSKKHALVGGRGGSSTPSKGGRRFRGKKNPMEVWVQVYETADMKEARMLQARLQEEEVECVLYEQGKKDIHGNALKGVGVAVPKSAVPYAQGVINRMPT